MKEGISNYRYETLPEPVTETFQKLEKGRDYTPIYTNARIPSIFKPEEYLIFFDPTQNELALQAEPPHYRTITFEDKKIPVVMEDDRGHTTNEIRFAVNVKGVGWLRPSMEGDRMRFHTQKRLVKDNATDRKNLGFMTRAEASFAVNNSETLIRHGIDTEVIWNVAALETIPFQGRHVPLTQLIDNGIIDDNKYVITTRLLKTNNRTGELQRRPEILEKAFNAYKNDMRYNLNTPVDHLPPSEIHHAYLRNLMGTLGKNLARLINANLAHNQLHGRNITLAGEIVDTVSVQTIDLPHWLVQGYDDFRQMIVTAYEFYKEYHRLGLTKETPQTVLQWYSTGFAANLSRTTRRSFEQAHGKDLVALTFDFARTIAGQNNPPTKRSMQTWQNMMDYIGT